MFTWFRAGLFAALFVFVTTPSPAAEKAFHDDAAITLEADLKDEAGTVEKPLAKLKQEAAALVKSQDYAGAADVFVQIVTVAPNDALLDKVKSNMQEVRARGGELYVLTDAETRIAASEGVNVIRLPEHYGLLSPILHVVPLQLLAYHTALARNTDVDKPRNLAKSVTVE